MILHFWTIKFLIKWSALHHRINMGRNIWIKDYLNFGICILQLRIHENGEESAINYSQSKCLKYLAAENILQCFSIIAVPKTFSIRKYSNILLTQDLVKLLISLNLFCSVFFFKTFWKSCTRMKIKTLENRNALVFTLNNRYNPLGLKKQIVY